MLMARRLKVVRIVTNSLVVPWHLGNMLKRLPRDFEVCVVGQDVSVHRDAFPDVKWVDININRKISIGADIVALAKLCHFFLEYKPDIVHSVMHKAALLAAVAGFITRVPVRINTFTSQYWATKHGLPRVIYYGSDRLINFLNTLCLTDSPSQSEFLRQHGISDTGGGPLPVLLKGSLSGVDLDRFNPILLRDKGEELRKTLNLERDMYVFLFLARKTRNKGAIDVLDAFSSVRVTCPNAHLLYVGPDESEGELDLLRDSRPDLFEHVIEVNRAVSNHEVYLAASDVLCLPSYMEGFGSVVIEAAAMGVPTIGSNIPGLVDSIEDGATGVLLPVGDIEALSNKMIDFVKNPGKYDGMRQLAIRRAEKYFSADMLYVALKDCYVSSVNAYPRYGASALRA